MNKKAKTRKENYQLNKRIFILAAVVLLLIVFSVYFFHMLRISKYTKCISRSEARKEILGFTPQIGHPRELSDSSRIAEGFAAEDLFKNGKKIGSDAVIFMKNPDAGKSDKIPKQAFLLLVTDNNLNIIGLLPYKPVYFDIGGDLNFNKFFSSFKGKDAISIIKGTDGIYTDNSDTALIVKNKVKEAISLFYIEKFGEKAFDKIAGTSFVFPERGTKVPDIMFTDSNGNKHKLSEFSNYKIIAIGGNPNCGGCVASIKRLSYEFKKYNLDDVKFIVFSFSDRKEDAANLTKYLPGDVIVVPDPNESFARKLKINMSPYIALINKNLKLFYRGPGEPIADTITNIKEFLGGKK